MSAAPLFPSFDGLLSLSRHEGVDIRPTLLRVLTDLYVQAPTHSEAEKRQFSELISRLVDGVDDSTRAAIRAKLMVCADTPPAVAERLGLAINRPAPEPAIEFEAPRTETAPQPAQLRPKLTMRPNEAAEIEQMFAAAGSSERILILQSLEDSPLQPTTRPSPGRAARAVEALEMAAFACDLDSFAFELANILLLPAKAASAIVEDAGGEAIACACKATGMDEDVFLRVLLFLKPEVGVSVLEVFRLVRLYAVLTDRAALIMVAVWRGATLAKVRANYRPALHDDERRPARPAAAAPQRNRPALPGQWSASRSQR